MIGDPKGQDILTEKNELLMTEWKTLGNIREDNILE